MMDVLQIFRDTGALLEGHFVLRSGLHSRQFFQCARVLQHPKIADQLHAEMARRVEEAGVNYDAVISPAMGGILVGQDVARHLNCEHIFAEKQDGQLAIRRFEIKPGTKFVVAEDVVTTGSAVKETIRLAREAGGEIVAVTVIVDRSGKNPVDFGCPFFSLLPMTVETFEPGSLPPDLAGTEAVKPGSK